MPSRASFTRFLMLLLPIVWPVSGKTYNDVVVLTNGDRIKGEIKKLDKEKLIVETDYSDEDFKIKWEKVAKVESDRTFLVETFDGLRTGGSITADKTDPKVTLVGTASKMTLPQIATIRPYEQSFWSRFDAGFDVGYSMTKANATKQLTANSNIVYTTEKSISTLAASIFFNEQGEAAQTRRWEVTPEYKRLLPRHWYASGLSDFYSSDEQQLDLRTSIGGGMGRYFLRSSKQYLAVGGGLAWTNERYMDPAVPNANSAEAYIGAEYMTEKLKIFDLITRFTLLPSLTVEGRYRSNFKFDLDFNLPGDWYMKTGFYNNFDSRPPEGLQRNDYGWTNSFGYKF
jgi:hypothetical protein